MESLRDKLLRLIIVPDGADPNAAVDALLAASYRCADHDALLPADQFAWRREPRRANGVDRQAYCRTHQSQRNSAAQKKRMQQTEARKAQTERAKARRPKDKAARAAWTKMDRRRNPGKYADRYNDWLERNRDKRKVSQDAYRERQKLRSRPSVRDARVTGQRPSIANARVRRDQDNES
jgi:hypothetical protein